MLGFAQKGGIADIVKAEPKVVLALGADEVDWSQFAGSLKVYIGHHGDKGAHAADIILPAAAYSEKDGTYVNTEGRVQFAEAAVFPPGDAREDWSILRALSDRVGQKLPYDSLTQLRAKLFEDHPTFGQVDYAPAGTADLATIGGAGEMGDAPFASPIKAFHLTNPVARASVTMAECAAQVSGAARHAAE